MSFSDPYDVNIFLDKPKGLHKFWNEHSEWSQKTFGPDLEVVDNVMVGRGPEGPLKHLEKEVKELQAQPYDLEEYADGVFLLFDACRRAGYTYEQLVDKTFEKLEKNKKRVWGKPDENGVVEHVRGIHD